MKLSKLPQFSLLAAFAIAGVLTGAEPAPNPKKPPIAVKKVESEPTSNDIHLVFEFIEVNHEQFSDWVFENPLKADAGELRKEVQAWTKKKEALIFETVIVHARSGQRAKVESIKEVIYPTEFDPAEVSTELELSDGAKGLVTPPIPTAFETRNTGLSVEVDPVISADGKFIDLNMAPEIVKLLEIYPWETEATGAKGSFPTPVFYTVKATTQVTMKNGSYCLIGTVRLPEAVGKNQEDPIVLMFARAEAD